VVSLPKMTRAITNAKSTATVQPQPAATSKDNDKQ
jgi:hypothetical protein